METITAYFEKIIQKQKEIGYSFPKILRPPTDLESISFTEEKLNLKFNDELRELYLIADGAENESNAIGLFPINIFLSMNDAILHHNAWTIFPDYFTNLETEITPGKKLFPFLADGAGNFNWVDLNEGTNNYGRIYWTNTYGDQPDYRYNSLTDFFKVTCECYNSGIIFLDDKNRLACDYNAFGKVSMKHNPNLTYWKSYLKNGS